MLYDTVKQAFINTVIGSFTHNRISSLLIYYKLHFYCNMHYVSKDHCSVSTMHHNPVLDYINEALTIEWCY